MHKQSEYVLISPDDFTEFINSKIKNCKTVHEYFKVIYDIIGEYNVFFINHARRKYYMSDVYLYEGCFQAIYPLKYITVGVSGYHKLWDKYRNSDGFAWYIGKNPKELGWKFGILKSVLR